MAARKRRSRRVNPRRRTHHRKAAPARARRRNPSRRRSPRRRRNWIAPGMVVAANPRRRRRSGRRNPARKHHRRHARRNPALFGIGMPSIKTVAFGAVGFVGPSMVNGFLTSTFPTVMSQITGWGIAGKYVVKAGAVLGLTWLTKRFVGANEANAVMVGGGANILISLANDFAPGILPANPLSMYLPNRPGMQAYTPVRPGLQGLRAVPVASIPTATQFPNMGTTKFGGTASRLLRY